MINYYIFLLYIQSCYKFLPRSKLLQMIITFPPKIAWNTEVFLTIS